MQIAERVGGRDRVLKHLGSAHAPEDLAALLEVARREARPGQEELDLDAGAVGLVPAGQSLITGRSSALLWHVVVARAVHRLRPARVRCPRR